MDLSSIIRSIAAELPAVPLPQDPSDDRLTLEEVVRDIPHDLEAVVVYLVLILSTGLAWWGHRHAGRRSAPPSAGSPPRDPEPPDAA